MIEEGFEVNTEYKNIVCPDCGNNDESTFDIIIDFGEEISEVKFGCKKCFEMFILTYYELQDCKILKE